MVMITLGITGSIGMGKSTLVSLLRERNIPVHDADEAVHRLLGPHGAAVATIARLFPDTQCADNSIDRNLLSRALADSDALKKLEAIIHPLVQADATTFTSHMAHAGHTIVGFDIPLLFETGGGNRFDTTICVSSPPHIQRERVLARPNMTPEKFAHILSRQMPDSEKRARADYVVENDGDLDHLRRQLEQVLTDIHQRHAGHYTLHPE